MNRRKLALGSLAAAAVLATAVAGIAAVAPGAQAVVKRPYDISWPQCPGGQPMPDATATSFVVIGLTRGRPFIENPCIDDQYAWASSNSIPAHAYTMLKYPQPDQVTTYGASGPWSTSTGIGRLRNVGYAEGKASVTTLARLGWKPKVVWMDVEQPDSTANVKWPVATTRGIGDRNKAVIEGAIRALEENGYAVGIYSNPNYWKTIVGTWWLPQFPAWTPTGQHSDTAARAYCTRATFSGGKNFLVQWTDGTYDFDLTCPSWNAAPKKAPAPSWGNDVNGDWKNDLLARRASDSTLFLYKGKGATRAYPFQNRVAAGTFPTSTYDLVETVGDLTGDGKVDLVARSTAGNLWLFPGTGGTTWGARRSLGGGWNAYKGITGVGDWTGDGKPDLGAIRKSDGMFVVWPGRGNGSVGTKTSVKSGLGGMDKVVGVGDVTLNGIPDVVMRQASTGTLYLYPGYSGGVFGPRVTIGTGWNTMALVAGVGDLTGDGVPDLVGRKKAAYGGDLFLYPGLTSGKFSPKIQIGTDWESMNAVA